MKAEKGDLIRIVAGEDAPRGAIYEAVFVDDWGDVYVDDKFNGSTEQLFFCDDEYVIHRKAGVEDAPTNATSTQEPSKWSDTQPNLIRLAATELSDLLVRKNHDYGDSFSQQYGKYGLMSALIRMDDKMRRLETLQGGQQAEVAESIGDTLLDLAGYALLAYVETQRK